ncbi:hypothetical protein DFS34DRAFT_653899 [Phlyctochytrium arcticum]|nr:hypothetical protein DFS34DRAFT_653899 [Phlyctochytrium arcticum]
MAEEMDYNDVVEVNWAVNTDDPQFTIVSSSAKEPVDMVYKGINEAGPNDESVGASLPAHTVPAVSAVINEQLGEETVAHDEVVKTPIQYDNIICIVDHHRTVQDPNYPLRPYLSCFLPTAQIVPLSALPAEAVPVLCVVVMSDLFLQPSYDAIAQVARRSAVVFPIWSIPLSNTATHADFSSQYKMAQDLARLALQNPYSMCIMDPEDRWGCWAEEDLRKLSPEEFAVIAKHQFTYGFEPGFHPRPKKAGKKSHKYVDIDRLLNMLSTVFTIMVLISPILLVFPSSYLARSLYSFHGNDSSTVRDKTMFHVSTSYPQEAGPTVSGVPTATVPAGATPTVYKIEYRTKYVTIYKNTPPAPTPISQTIPSPTPGAEYKPQEGNKVVAVLTNLHSSFTVKAKNFIHLSSVSLRSTSHTLQTGMNRWMAAAKVSIQQVIDKSAKLWSRARERITGNFTVPD